jgi:hypothetical protein
MGFHFIGISYLPPKGKERKPVCQVDKFTGSLAEKSLTGSHRQGKEKVLAKTFIRAILLLDFCEGQDVMWP